MKSSLTAGRSLSGQRMSGRAGAALALGVVMLGLSGCVVAPVEPRPAVMVPGPQVYVAPAYAAPGPGWVWMSHPHRGYGWHHHHHGWHRGWR